MNLRLLRALMKVVLFFVLFVIAFPASLASTATDPILNYIPTYEWHTFYGGYDYDNPVDFVLDGDGNIYVAGQSCSDWVGLTPLHQGVFGDFFDPFCSAFVAKYDKNGVYKWHTFYGSNKGSSASDIQLDSSGNVLVIGTSGGEWQGLSPRRAHNGGTDLFILKLSNQGIYQWHTFFGSTVEESVAGFAVDRNGSLLITGNSCADWVNLFPLHAFGGDCSLFVLKTDLNGAYQWHTFFGSSNGSTNSSDIQLDQNGNVFISGYSRGLSGLTPLHAHSDPNGGRYSYDTLVLKLSPAGNYQWHTFYGSKEYEYGTSLALDDSGNLYVTGFSDGDWEGLKARHPFTAEQTFSRNMVVFKLDNQGAYQWHTFYGNSFATDIVLDQHGLLYVSGPSGQWDDIIPDSPYTGATDAVLLTLDTQGNYVRHSYFGSPLDDHGGRMGWDSSGNLIMVGVSGSDWPGKTPLHALSQQSDMFIMKLSIQEVLVYSTNASIAVNRNPIPAGFPLQITATITSVGGTPTGEVVFMVGTSVLGEATLNNGVATLQTAFVTEGNHVITAKYKGSRSYLPSAAQQPINLQSIKAETITTVQTSKVEAKGGEPVTLLAVVSAVEENNLTPAGTVTFMEGSTVLGISTLSGGMAQLSINFSATGVHPVTAVYGGSQTFLTSTSSAKEVKVVKEDVNIQLEIKPGMSVPYGNQVLVAAKILSVINGSLPPTGSVTFKAGNITLGIAPIVNGEALFNLPLLMPGQHQITAEYSGCNLYNPAGPTGTTLEITKLTTTISLHISAGRSFRPEQPTDITVTVQQPQPVHPVPTGKVTIFDGAHEVGTLDVNNGSLTLSQVTLTKGIHSLRAIYSGDSIYRDSTSLDYEVLITDHWIYLPAVIN